MAARICTDPEQTPWPDTEAGDRARRWLTPLMRDPTTDWIRNVHTQVEVIVDGDLVLPATPTIPHPDNSYVCSPWTHYVGYGRQELDKLESPALEAGLWATVTGMGAYLRAAGLERVVYVNNWLLSTNLYDEITPAQVDAAHRALLDRHADRAIVWRSVDVTGNPELRTRLLELGYEPVFARIVWYADPRSRAVRRSRSLARDRAVWKRSGYRLVTGQALDDADFERVKQLYDLLYVDKYSAYNPQFTTRFLRRWCREGLLDVRALVKDGRIDGVMGSFTRRCTVTAPLFGYDTTLPQHTGLYRMLTWNQVDEMRQRDVRLHMSAGVGHFKKARGAEHAVEHNLVYTRHLPASRRAPWRLLQTVLDRVAVPMILQREL